MEGILSFFFHTKFHLDYVIRVKTTCIFLQFGFFKRSRPEKDEMEQEPLKSENGHLQRDEAL